MTKTRKFHTPDVVTVYTGIMVSNGGIGSVYELCGWMLNESIFTHQLPAATRTLMPYIAREHPWIADIRLTSENVPALERELASIVEEHGATLTLTRPDSPDWVRGNALADLVHIADGRPVILVTTEEENR